MIWFDTKQPPTPLGIHPRRGATGMNDAQREEVALFRFGLISDLVGATQLEYGEFERLVKQKSSQRWNIPGSQRTRISPSTIRRWVHRYHASGGDFASLYPAARSDRGKSRTVDDETIAALVKLRTQKPTTPLALLLTEMQEKDLVSPGVTLRLSTAYRILKRQGLSGRSPRAPTDRRRFEAESPNDLWQSDVLHGPSVTVDGKLRKSYLIGFIDDHSRLLPHAEFYLSERLASWLDGFRQALLTRGLPRKLYVDNGPLFRSKHLERICASLGIALTHTPPYTPQGRGKIERFFRTVRTQLLPGFRTGTLPQLNGCLRDWIGQDYHLRVHSSTGESPLERFARHLELVRTAPPDLEDHFRKEVRRRVAKDRTVSLNGTLFEAPTLLLGERVQLLYHEHQPGSVEVFHKGKSYGELRPVDLHVNARAQRDRHGDVTLVDEPSRSSPPSGQLPFTPRQVKS
jgi:transposase InsO family protein